MANLRKVIYINEEDYSTLINGDSLVIDGTTYTYEENALYVIKNAGPPEYAETAGYATNAGTSQVAVTDASGNNIAATYGKKPLIIEVEDGDTEVPSGTFDSITGALNNGSRVIIKFISGDEYNTDIYYLPLTLHILCYTFEALIYKKYIWIEIDEYNNVSINNYNVSDDTNVIHLNTTETITGNKTFSGTVSLGSNATATTPATTDNDTSVATTAFVHNVVNAIPEITTGHIVGRMHRDNVSGTGNLTITGASGEGFSPNGITTAGKYVVVVYSWSDTKTFGYNLSFGGNSYTLSTTDGTISDKRELTVSAGALWSGSVTTAVSAGTTIIVEIYKAEKTTPALSVGTVALTNLYNDLDGKPTISSSTSSTSTTDIASSKAVKLAYDHGGVQSVNGLTGAVNLALGDTNVIESISVNGVALTITNKNVDITLSTEVDSELDPESTNPVENQAIFHALKKPGVNNNGHEYVDLGLPSGTLWATVNIGASSESSPGYIREWGETTEEYTPFHDNKYYSNDSYTKYNTTDHLTTLEPEDDAAVVYWGGDWRMPTQTEAQELIDECTWTQEKVNGQLGARVTGTNGNSIFMPYDTFWLNGTEYTNYGSIWTSTVGASNENILNAKLLFYFLGTGASIEVSSYARKRSGAAIRPVIKESYLDRYAKVDDSSYDSYEVTYAELKQLRDTNQLIPGKYYRIIDYVTTAWHVPNDLPDSRRNSWGIASASHPFDIIVRADSTNTINENAYATWHDGDTYFYDSDPDSCQNLPAWELKYSLDNYDKSAESNFETAVTAGVYKACVITNSSGDPVLYITMDSSDDYYEYYDSYADCTKVSDYGMVCPFYCSMITFSASDLSIGDTVTIKDATTSETVDTGTVLDIGQITYESKGNIYYMKDEYDNEAYYDFKNIVYFHDTDWGRLSANKWYYTFNAGTTTSYDASIKALSAYNKLLYYGLPCIVCISTNVRRGYWSNNMFDVDCANICISTNTGEHNEFIGRCHNILITGDSSSYNSFRYSNNITIQNANYNIFKYNSYIVFGDSNGTKDYYRYIIIELGNQYIYLNNTQTTSNSNQCQNIKICQGVNNTTTWKLIDVGVVGNQYLIEYKNENSKTITV